MNAACLSAISRALSPGELPACFRRFPGGKPGVLDAGGDSERKELAVVLRKRAAELSRTTGRNRYRAFARYRRNGQTDIETGVAFFRPYA